MSWVCWDNFFYVHCHKFGPHFKRSMVRVLQSPGYWILSPPMVNLVWFDSFLLWDMSHTIHPYVMSFLLCVGIWFWWIKNIVFAPCTHSGIPWVSWFCFWKSIVNLSYTLAMSWVACIPTVFLFPHLILLLQFHGCCLNGLLSHAAHIHSCIIVMCFVFDHMFAASPIGIASCFSGLLALRCGH